jgi:hypothetical protein
MLAMDVSTQTEVRLRTAVLRLRSVLAAAQVIAAGWRVLALLAKANFDPNQPRVPRGEPEGGEWTGVEGAGSTTEIDALARTAARLGLANGPEAYGRCLNLCYPLLERPQTPGSDRNQWDFHRCMNACLGKDQ